VSALFGLFATSNVYRQDDRPFGQRFHAQLEPADRTIRKTEFVFHGVRLAIIDTVAQIIKHVGQFNARIAFGHRFTEQLLRRTAPLVGHYFINIQITIIAADYLTAFEHVIKHIPVFFDRSIGRIYSRNHVPTRCHSL